MKYLLSLIAVLAACGTSHLKVAPVTVEPIHLTIDVNVHDEANATPRR
jgi:hypothetical protein